MSPFLFLLAAEGFNVLMSSSIEAGLFHGYHVGQGTGLCLSHLQFADDTLIIGKKMLGECAVYTGCAFDF